MAGLSDRTDLRPKKQTIPVFIPTSNLLDGLPGSPLDSIDSPELLAISDGLPTSHPHLEIGCSEKPSFLSV